MANPTLSTNASQSDIGGKISAQIKDGAREVSDDVSSLAKEAVESGKELYDAGHERLRAEVEHLKTALSKLGDKAVQQGEVSLDAVTDAIAARPLLSLFGAFAAGVALSLLLGGRRPS